MMYSVGAEVIPLHAMCGRWYEVLKNGVRMFVLVGSRDYVEAVVAELNREVTK